MCSSLPRTCSSVAIFLNVLIIYCRYRIRKEIISDELVTNGAAIGK